MSSNPSYASLIDDCELKELRSHMAGYYPFSCQLGKDNEKEWSLRDRQREKEWSLLGRQREKELEKWRLLHPLTQQAGKDLEKEWSLLDRQYEKELKKWYLLHPLTQQEQQEQQEQQQITRERELDYAEFDKRRAIRDAALKTQFWLNEKKLNRTPEQQKIDYQNFVRNTIGPNMLL